MAASLITKDYFKGKTVKQVSPLLQIIAEQNGLKLSNHRYFRICKNILIKSINEN